ncbi:MAG: YebC/PmpR family DNA-binding transcriptional regulator [Candidatus Hydrogenedentota bacterium]
MSGHSKWSTIKRKKGAIDAKRGKIFSKLAKEVIVAAKAGGGDPEGNPRLRTVISSCRAANMPMDKVEKAIKKGIGDDGGVAYDEVRYEGYGAGGVAIIVDTLTDNRNRTVADIRFALNKCGGSMAESGAVTWNFESKGFVVVPKDAYTEDEIFEKAIEAGADDVNTESDVYEITTEPTELHNVVAALEEAGVKFEEAKLTMLPKTTTEVDAKVARQILKLIDMLEDSDDVQQVYSNFDVSEEDMAVILAES